MINHVIINALKRIYDDTVGGCGAVIHYYSEYYFCRNSISINIAQMTNTLGGNGVVDTGLEAEVYEKYML